MAGRFDADELLLSTRDGRHFVVRREFTFTRPIGVGGQTIRVPAGAMTDGASTPAVIWSKLPPFGSYFMAAVLHDAAYRGVTVPVIADRDTADLLLLEACLALGVDEETTRLLFNGVQLFGDRAWEKDRGADK
jgi:hypothetical protein